MSPDATTTSPSDWRYIAEGGSSIVFFYNGPPNPDFDATALRLRKTANDVFPVIDESVEEEEPDDPTILFQHQVIQRLMPAEYLPRLDAVRVGKEWLEELKKLNEEIRPLERREKDGIDVRKRKAVLATDLVGGTNGFTVEIKPKWGFLPSPTHLSIATRPVKTNTCRFCMHSHLKSSEGEEVSLGYCPLDLYSGQEDRIKKALHALWDVWIGSSGSVNNLRVFVDGQIVSPSLLPSSLAPLAKKLPLPDPSSPPSLTGLRDAFTDAILPLLMDIPVLRVLSTLQRNLDALDVEGLSVLWSQAYASVNAQAVVDGGAGGSLPVPPLGTGLAEPTLEDWKAFLDIYLTKHANMDHDHPDAANIKYYCMAYLLSTSFKDCSIILRLPRDGANTVTVIDLDVKPVDRMSKWEKLDKKIVQSYSSLSEPTHCVDQWASQTS
ncbi:hypothetical protein PHLCEN_2v1354 [Hermanssonia centrifuga]|uniref:Inositol-pentakisphosphate 2-kinase n=1 Tax=Hermanssonia centrifuga TaxID=98765 RepID=A0A2R6S3F0_9APHY|nr:hypothetical protein PHLCEN_2v1354 [Hermanssonia centrifuga]